MLWFQNLKVRSFNSSPPSAKTPPGFYFTDSIVSLHIFAPSQLRAVTMSEDKKMGLFSEYFIHQFNWTSLRCLQITLEMSTKRQQPPEAFVGPVQQIISVSPALCKIHVDMLHFEIGGEREKWLGEEATRGTRPNIKALFHCVAVCCNDVF